MIVTAYGCVLKSKESVRERGEREMMGIGDKFQAIGFIQMAFWICSIDSKESEK